MFLTICIPTHNGRGWCLKEAVDEMLHQISSDCLLDIVEICVSDNASSDSTAAYMEDIVRRYPSNITYMRMPMDCGVYNFLNVVRVSRGTYCWLFGSDDIPAPGAIRGAVKTLETYPECSGMSSHYFTYDITMTHLVAARAPEVYPDNMQHERQFILFKDALSELGPSLTFMSVQFFRRDLWNDSIGAASTGFIYIAPHHVHTYLISRILKERPQWVWTPKQLVKMRSGNTVQYTLHEGPTHNHTVMALREMTTIWSEVCGSDRSTFRATLRKAYRVDWNATVVRHHKMLQAHTGRDDIDMLVQFTRYLAALPEFWWGAFPALLIPHWFWKFFNSSGVLTLIKKKLLGR